MVDDSNEISRCLCKNMRLLRLLLEYWIGIRYVFSGLKLDHRYYINLGDLQTLAVIPEILHKNKQNLPR